MTKRAFAVVAHPDDIEFLMAGTLAHLGRAGYELHYMNIANGCCGTTEYDRATIARIRREESIAAANVINAIYHDSLCDDLAIFYNQDTLARMSAVMREVNPQIVLTHAPVDYMEDHTNTCRLVVTAAFARGMPNFPVIPPRAHATGPTTVYHAQPYSNRTPLGEVVYPQIYVDTTNMLDIKAKMLSCHASQKKWLDQSQGLDSYIHTMRELDREVGSFSGKYAFAEGFRKHSHLGFCGPDDDPLSQALSQVSFRK